MTSLFSFAESHPKLFGFYFVGKTAFRLIGTIIAIALLLTVLNPVKVFSKIEDSRDSYEQTQATISAARERAAERAERGNTIIG